MSARGLLCSAAIVAFSLPGLAWGDEGWGADIEVMPEAQMRDLRGGFNVGPNLQINFGAQITTYVNGVPALTTNLTWTDMGQFVEQTVGEIGQRIDALSPEQRAELGVSEMENAGGVVISDADGVTALVHNVTEGALQNIILNTATGRDLRQEVDVTLELPGFEAIQDSLILERFGIRIDDDMRSVVFGAGG